MMPAVLTPASSGGTSTRVSRTTYDPSQDEKHYVSEENHPWVGWEQERHAGIIRRASTRCRAAYTRPHAALADVRSAGGRALADPGSRRVVHPGHRRLARRLAPDGRQVGRALWTSAFVRPGGGTYRRLMRSGRPVLVDRAKPGSTVAPACAYGIRSSQSRALATSLNTPNRRPADLCFSSRQ